MLNQLDQMGYFHKLLALHTRLEPDLRWPQSPQMANFSM